MKRDFILPSEQQKAVSGTANVLIDSLGPFDGVVATFKTDGEVVRVTAKQQFDSKRSAVLIFEFGANINNGQHEYTKESGLYLTYMLVEDVGWGTQYIFYSAVYGSGTVKVTFDSHQGTLAVGFDLDVQNDETEPRLNAIGAFRDVSGLEHMKK
ncbi:hypothetical protein [Pseudomonas fluorescens]|uniref:Uncharacterized protein n=1 Tax=Pseudomonas fluorescens TaxID=294 RepID=A0A423LA98_PSEFL|nr:hypothetical protein [Pseudomonas fluorescens]RON65220.1 hypothetical protein BK671_19205 [Pseudomonas fluorescens]